MNRPGRNPDQQRRIVQPRHGVRTTTILRKVMTRDGHADRQQLRTPKRKQITDPPHPGALARQPSRHEPSP